MARTARAVLRVLPAGHSLPHDSWVRRHRQICVLLWLHVPAVALFGLLRGAGLGHAVFEGTVIAVCAAGASTTAWSKTVRSSLAVVGLVTSSAVLTHLSGGLIEMHFHFFVVVVVVSLYQAWQPFLIALGYVVLHHGVVGALDPAAVYNHPAALESPWRWALVHGVFILAQSAACLVGWRVNEDALQGERGARRALEKANEDLAEAQAISSVGSWDWDLVTNTVWWSEEMHRIAGLDPATFEPSTESFAALVHPSDRPRVQAVIQTLQARGGNVDEEYRMVCVDGAVRTIHALGRSVQSEDGSPLRVMGTCQDITERKALEEEVEHRALHDSLTGLGNRVLFLDRVEHALARGARSGSSLALLYLDLDDFKTVNDSLGHGVGDALLVEVSQRLLGAVRSADTVVRLGGDEFAVLVEDADGDDGQEAARRITEALHAPVLLGGQELSPRASIGIAVANDDTEAAYLLRDADIAMYAAKRQGRGGWQMFDAAMLTSAVTRMELQAELRGALEDGQLVVHLQPVVDLQSGRLESVEALVRWNHPRRGLLGPDEFIGLAEETGLIVPIGAWVTAEAARHAARLQEATGRSVSVSVNLSPRQLTSDVVEMVEAALSGSGLAPSSLVLEITETSLMSQEDAAVAKLEALRDKGIRIAIDDFGTGYSSLAYLSRLPIDILKVDRSFVACITDGPEQSALAHAIIKLARIFDLAVIAEGVETSGQAQTLLSFGCHSGQGYYFCPPVEVRELVEDPRWRSPAPPARYAALVAAAL